MKQDYAKALALMAMERAGLDKWTFGFDDHPSRVSSVRMKRRHLTISTVALSKLDDSEILGNFLHNVVHAVLESMDHDAAFTREAVHAGATLTVRCLPLEAEYEAHCRCGKAFYRTKEPDPQYPSWFHEECGRGAILTFN